MGLFDFLKNVTMGVDPGSQNFRLIKDGELVFNERSQISIDKAANKLSGYGDTTQASANDVVISPINYVIADFQAFEMLLRAAIRKGHNASPMLSRFKIHFVSRQMLRRLKRGLTGMLLNMQEQ